MPSKPFGSAQGKRILIFSLSYSPLVGGAEIAIKEITDRIQDLEFDMVTLRFDKSHPRRERVGNVNVFRIGGGWGYLSKIIFIPQAVFFAIRRKYNLYWVMMTYMIFPAAIIRLMGRTTSYVITLQDGDQFYHVFGRFRIKIFKPLRAYGFRHAYRVQAISTFLAPWAKEMGYGGKVEMIPNGVDNSKFRMKEAGLRKESVTIITTSRLVQKNAVGDIIDAFKFLPENINLQIVGSGSLEESLKSRVEGLKLEKRITFLGEVPNSDISLYLNKADIFVRPSLSEGMGISFIEAMAVGLPVIATAVGGIPDFLKDGETGLFCEVRNPESIARQVKKLIDDESLRNKIVTNARAMIEQRFNWDFLANEMKSRFLTIPA